MIIIGISAFYHDSAACLIKDGEIIAAAQEERFTRIKHDSSFPKESIKFCLKEAEIDLSEIDYIIFYEKPFVKFERLIENYLSVAPFGIKVFIKTLPVWIKNKFFQKNIIFNELKKININKSNKYKLLFCEHHESHAASAFYPSNFLEAATLTIDGVGEYTTTSIGVGKHNDIKIIKEIHYPHSLGLLYSSFTYYLGFKVNSAEYKVMGLAPYGSPVYKDIILKEMIDLKDDGSFRLNKKYFSYTNSFQMTNNTQFERLFNFKKRKSEEKLFQHHMDLAASIQEVTNIIVLQIIKHTKKITNQKNLVMAGGVALNCVTNGFIEKEKVFDNIWIQPASGDAGCSLGAALLLYFKYLKNKRIIDYSKIDRMNGTYLGPSFSNNSIQKTLDTEKVNYDYYKDENKLIKYIAGEISNQKIIGWFNGKMEFGPRSLGNRSILCDPRSEKMQRVLNLKIKFREGFRPFAPSVISEEFDNWFSDSPKNPYMLFVTQILNKRLVNYDSEIKGFDLLNIKRSSVSAITHVDNSARYQVVFSNLNQKFYKLIKQFYNITDCPILVNTSFNVRGEPIVCTPDDALKCFFGTNLDILVLENFIIKKENNNKLLNNKYKNKFDLD